MMPYSTCVHSGGKSLHFILALEEDVGAAEYERLAKWLLNIVDKADQSVKNPSRLSRFPGVTRESNGNMQELLEVRGRVPLAVFKKWLELYPQHEPKINADVFHLSVDDLGPTERGLLWPSTFKFLREEAPPGFRNRYLFLAACDFHEQGYPIEEALTQLGKSSTLDGTEFAETVQSAYERPPKYGVRTWGLRFTKKVS
jgi:hypothetical protein